MAAKATTPDRRALEKQPAPATRRRGAKLETALLDAAWSELTAVGYGAFTIEGVAARAKTSRAVLYRRWPNRAELAVAAIRHYMLTTATEIPDAGTLREDVLALLRQISERGAAFAGVFSFLIADYFEQTGLSLSDMREQIIAGTPNRMDAIIERAVERGEIDPGRLKPRIVSLPLDLVRHDFIVNSAPVSESTLIDIVDNLFLPLLGADGHDVEIHMGAYA